MDRDCVLSSSRTHTECKTSRQSERENRLLTAASWQESSAISSKKRKHLEHNNSSVYTCEIKEALHSSEFKFDGNWWPVTLVNVVLGWDQLN